MHNKIKLGGIETTIANRSELVSLVFSTIENYRNNDVNRPTVIMANNINTIALAKSDRSLRSIINSADVVTVDGFPVLALGRYLSSGQIYERSATTDLFHDFTTMSFPEKQTYYLLGGPNGLAENCAALMEKMHNRLSVVGTNHGFFSTAEEPDIVAKINQSKPNILWVGLGVPNEQMFVWRNLERLKVPCVITCGGCFNYVTGDYKRAPYWMRSCGLEWLYRVMLEPRRLSGRYFRTAAPGLTALLTESNLLKGRVL